MASDLAELMRAEANAAAGDDEARLLSLYADDAVFRYPGVNPLAGEYRGRDGIAEFRRKRAALLAGATVEAELHDVLANDEHGIQLYAVSAEKSGRRAAWRSAVVCHARDGTISDAWVVVDPQADVDAFLTSISEG